MSGSDKGVEENIPRAYRVIGRCAYDVLARRLPSQIGTRVNVTCDIRTPTAWRSRKQATGRTATKTTTNAARD